MLRMILFLLVGLFVLELLGLFTLGKWIGAWNTLAIVLITGIIGVWLAKREGWQTIRLLRLQLAKGEIPGQAVLDGICILIGGALLVTPGLITDLLGFILLIPYTRNIVKAWLRKSLEKWIRNGRFIILRR